MGKIRFVVFISLILISSCNTLKNKKNTIWAIGEFDHSAAEFALAPDDFESFLENDFGFEDKFFLINHSETSENFPYVLPGPVDTWGGTWPTSGWRTNEVNILFSADNEVFKGDYTLVIELTDYAKKYLPLVKIRFNDHSKKVQLSAEGYDLETQKNPTLKEPYVDSVALLGDLSDATPETLEMTVPAEVIKKGGNQITITILEGSWIMFDQIRLKGHSFDVKEENHVFIRQIKAADYELEVEGKSVQPLIVDVEYLEGKPELSVILDGKSIFRETVEQGRYAFEVPMPAVTEPVKSNYEIRLDGRPVESGTVIRDAQQKQTLADYVDTRIGTGHSRWMIAPGPWMPFSMVKLSSDNQNAGWQAGYQPSFESIGTFSHIHEWTLAGLGDFCK